MSLDPYEELGVPRDASEEQIKKAHRRGVRKHHPDAGGSPEKFGTLQRSYEILVDPDKRQKYDETGATEGQTVGEQEAKVLEGVMQVITVAVNDAMDLETTDVKQVIKGILAQATQKLADAKRDQQRTIRRLETLEKKFRRRGKRSGKADDPESTILRLAIKGQHDAAAKGMRKLEEEIAVHERVCGVFAAFDYDFTPPPPQPFGKGGMPGYGFAATFRDPFFGR